MAIDLQALLGSAGVRAAREVITEVDPHTVSRWVSAGRLVRPLPGVLALPGAAGTWRGRASAAVQWGGGHLSGRTALALHDLVGHPGARLHLTVDPGRNVPRLPDWLRVHRAEVPAWSIREGFPVTPEARSLVDAWGHAHAGTGYAGDVPVVRAAVIGALQQRHVRPAVLQRELARHPRLPGRRELARLVALVAGGCQSEFEIWGLRHILDVPGLPPVQQQRALETRIGTIHVDGAWEDARLGVELDGAAYHRKPDSREHDLRRDAAALAEGWATMRVGFRRAHVEPGVYRSEIATTHAVRRALFR